MQAALAENAFARLNFEALIGDGSKASYTPQLEAIFKSVVYFSDGQPMIDQRQLLALGVLAPSVTAARLRDVLRFDDVGGTRERRAFTALGGETLRTPRARPAGWAMLGELAPKAGSSQQPTESGWYLRVRLAWPDRKFPKPIGSHSALGYYDAEKKRWEMTSSLDYEYEPESIPVPGIGGEMSLDTDRHVIDCYPVTMGPTAKAQGVTPAQFHRAMLHDVVALEAHYRALAKRGSPDRNIFYHFVPSMSGKRIDGNCNTYASYLLASLGVREAYPHGGGRLGTVGSEVISRDDAGDVFIYGSGDAAQAKAVGRATNRFGVLGAFITRAECAQNRRTRMPCDAAAGATR